VGAVPGKLTRHAQQPVLGIDFGTSNSAAALVDAAGQIHVITLDGNSNSMPTALYFAGEDGHISYGSAALRDYLSAAQEGVIGGRLMRAIKSLLGSSLMAEQTVVNGQTLSFFDIVVLFLSELKRRAEQHLGYGVHTATLGRPVHFVDGNPERDALAQATLRRAALAAGFRKVAFELEPIAAAFDFERRVSHDTQVLVVDIGGGTSDFTVIRIGPGHRDKTERKQDILATSGIHIGGTDFDRLLDLGCVMPLLGYGQRTPAGRELPNRIFYNLSTWHLVHHATSRHSLAQARALQRDYADPVLHQRLMHVLQERLGHQLLSEVESAKIRCATTGASTAIDVSGLHTRSSSANAAPATQLTPEMLHTMLNAQLAAIVQCALQCAAQAGLSDLELIYLTGGSSSLQALVHALQTAFPKATMVHGDRFGGVASGLAWAAANNPALCA
jgi:hypothetical chaperone protein